MADALIFPYATLDEKVELEFFDPSVDGHRGEGVAIRERAVDVYDLGFWNDVTLKARVRVDAEALDAVATAPRVVVTVHCGFTNLRHAVVLERDGGRGGSFTGEVMLERELLATRAEVHAVVAGVVDGVADRYVGESAVHTVNLQPPRSPDITGDLDVQWRDFTAEPALAPELHDQASYLELEPVGKQAPVLWLNTNVSELPRLLDERSGRTPLERALRDVVFDTIAASALQTMLHSAIAGARSADAAGGEWPDGWRQDVLRALLPLMAPELDVEQALEAVVGSPDDPTYHAAAHTAVARFLRTTKNTINAIEILEDVL
jgi:hypothetical protein